MAGSISATPDVVFITASVGAGHNAVAHALQRGITQRDPEVQTHVIDDMPLVPRWFRAVYEGGFEFAVVHLPRWYGLGFRLSDGPHRPGRSRSELLRMALERHALSALRNLLLELQPRFIIHTHFLAPAMVSRLIECGALASKQAVVVTDRNVHRVWYAECVDHWYVASEAALATLNRWAVPAQHVTLSGIPIDPKWRLPLQREAVLSEWDLPADRPIVLISGGATYTTGPIAGLAERLSEANPGACLCVLTGRNERLTERIAARSGDPNRLRAIPMTDRLQELAHVARLMITKPGGITTAECLAKALPMVLLPPVPGQESANARFFTDHGAAVIARRWKDVLPMTTSLLNDPARLQAMSQAAGRLDQPATDTVVDAILASLGRGAG